MALAVPLGSWLALQKGSANPPHTAAQPSQLSVAAFCGSFPVQRFEQPVCVKTHRWQCCSMKLNPTLNQVLHEVLLLNVCDAFSVFNMVKNTNID